MQTVPTKTPTTETPTSESLIKERDRGHVLVPWRAQGGERGPVVRDSLARHCDEHRFVHGHTYGPAQVTARGVWQCAHFYDPEASRAA